MELSTSLHEGKEKAARKALQKAMLLFLRLVSRRLPTDAVRACGAAGAPLRSSSRCSTRANHGALHRSQLWAGAVGRGGLSGSAKTAALLLVHFLVHFW